MSKQEIEEQLVVARRQLEQYRAKYANYAKRYDMYRLAADDEGAEIAWRCIGYCEKEIKELEALL